MTHAAEPLRATADGRAVVAVRAAVALLGLLAIVPGCATEPDGPAASPTATAAPMSSETPPATEPTTAPTVPEPPPPLSGARVVIDPGHNRDNGTSPETRQMVDAGGFAKQCNTTGTATADGYAESTFAWELAGVLVDRLRAAGAETVLTRDADAGWGPCIDERGRMAGEIEADVLVSLHADGSALAGHAGFHVIRPATVPGWTDDIDEESAELARAVRDALVAAGFTPSNYRGTDGIDVRADLGTLNWSDVPAVVIETHNMRDPGEAALFRTTETHERLADAVAGSLAEFAGRDG